MKVLGVVHSTQDPSYQTTLNYISKQIHWTDRIALESPMNIEVALRKGKECPCPQHTFLAKTIEAVRAKGTTIIAVEDRRAFEAMCARRDWFMHEPGRFANDWVANWLSNYRSLQLLKQAHEQKATHLITGVCHAYDLAYWGHQDVTYLCEINMQFKRAQERWLVKRQSQRIATEARKYF